MLPRELRRCTMSAGLIMNPVTGVIIHCIALWVVSHTRKALYKNQLLLLLLLCFSEVLLINFNPNKTGEGGGGHDGPPWSWPPWHFARLLCNAQSSCHDTLWQFSFKFPAHFDTKFATPGGTVPKLRNFCICTSDRKGSKCDFVYKINANWIFSPSWYKYAYF